MVRQLERIGARFDNDPIAQRPDMHFSCFALNQGEDPAGPRTIFATVGSGGSTGASPLQEHIGLGRATAIHSLEITWPATGKMQPLRDLSLDRRLYIREDKDAWDVINTRTIPIPPLPAPTAAAR